VRREVIRKGIGNVTKYGKGLLKLEVVNS